MVKYGKSGVSQGVSHYEIHDTYIKIKFNYSDIVYKYSYRNPGRVHVEKMKQLALQNEKLTTYISQNVQKDYESKS
jgi:hypothetical protein